MTEYRKELISPDGKTYVSTSPRETNDLIYGSGYREAGARASESDKPASDKPAPTKVDKATFASGGEVPA